MKTRLILSSVSLITAAVTLAFVMRPSATAQDDSPPPSNEEVSLEAEPYDEEEHVIEDHDPDSMRLDLEDSADPVVEEEIRDEGRDDIVVSGDEEESTLEGTDGEEGVDPASAEAEDMVFEVDEFETGDVDDMAVRADDKSELLSVDFPDEEIRAILRVVADLFELNLVVPQELTGRASITLRNVTWPQVFDVVLSPAGFTYIEEGNIIKVVSLESLTREPPQTRVVILNYAQAVDIRAIIEPMVSTAGGRVQVDSRTNALVISAPPTQLRRVENTIQELDKPNAQVMIESKFVETRNQHLENIGVNWASLDGWGASAGPFEHEYLRERNVDSNETTRGFDSDTSRITTAVFSADRFGVILSALREDNDVKLVSNPTVVTLDSRPAEIHIGEEFPIVLPRFNPQTGTYEAGEYSTIDIGIKLDVTPQVNAAGFINLIVEPDVSTLSSTISYFGADYPVRSTRRARSEVTIKDGFTLAIGGLVQDDIVNVETSVPVLGSIPGIGRLFRSDRKDNDQRNLIIFLTARTLDPEGGTLEDTVDPRQIRTMGLTREEMPGYRPDMPLWDEEPGEAEPAVEVMDPVAEPEPVMQAEVQEDPAEEVEVSQTVEIAGPAEDEEAAEATTSTDSSEEGSEEVEETAEAGSEMAEEDAADEELEEEAAEVSSEEEEQASTAPETRRTGGWLTPSR